MRGKSQGISLNYMARYYDLITHGERSRFRKNQIELMKIQEGESVLEVGCGTGVLTVLSKIASGPSGRVEGVDIAPRMIERCRSKAKRLGLSIGFQTASIHELPFSDNSFDLVISSLMFHHLPMEVKQVGLDEVHRVLRVGGRLFLCDFGRPHPMVYPLSWLMFVWRESMRVQIQGRLPGLLREHGFCRVETVKKGIFLDYLMAWKE